MERTAVTSSNIQSVGYDSATETLEVEFIHGGIYHYTGVPSGEFEALMSAESHGKYLNANIKGRYPYAKL